MAEVDGHIREFFADVLAALAPRVECFGDFRNWRILTRLRLDPARATMVLRALLVLTRQHTTR